jgi:hypothetical protein
MTGEAFFFLLLFREVLRQLGDRCVLGRVAMLRARGRARVASRRPKSGFEGPRAGLGGEESLVGDVARDSRQPGAGRRLSAGGVSPKWPPTCPARRRRPHRSRPRGCVRDPASMRREKGDPSAAQEATEEGRQPRTQVHGQASGPEGLADAGQTRGTGISDGYVHDEDGRALFRLDPPAHDSRQRSQ